MTPIDRFTLDHSRINFLTDDEYTEEVFFVEETRQVSKTNLFSINSNKWECPVDLLNVNKDLKSRITYSASIKPLNDDDLESYIVKELESVRMGINTFNEGSMELIIRSAQGNLRLCRADFCSCKICIHHIPVN